MNLSHGETKQGPTGGGVSRLTSLAGFEGECFCTQSAGREAARPKYAQRPSTANEPRARTPPLLLPPPQVFCSLEFAARGGGLPWRDFSLFSCRVAGMGNLIKEVI